MAEVVRVLVSPNGSWRVDVQRDGRAEIRRDGFLLATIRESELAGRLAKLGVSLSSLFED